MLKFLNMLLVLDCVLVICMKYNISDYIYFILVVNYVFG